MNQKKKKNIFAVCDLEVEYAYNFMEYLSQRRNLPFEVQAFTSAEILCEYAKTQHIFIHYSNQEHTYKEHICDLIKDLKNKGFSIMEDIASYKEHSDISYYFPDFLKKTIEEIIADKAE